MFGFLVVGPQQTTSVIIVIFPFVLSTSDLFGLLIWITLILCSIIFFIWLGKTNNRQNTGPLIPVSRQCPNCASFLPINADFCFVCGKEFVANASLDKKIKKSI
jgi:hypothetical protein